MVIINIINELNRKNTKIKSQKFPIKMRKLPNSFCKKKILSLSLLTAAWTVHGMLFRNSRVEARYRQESLFVAEMWECLSIAIFIRAPPPIDPIYFSRVLIYIQLNLNESVYEFHFSVRTRAIISTLTIAFGCFCYWISILHRSWSFERGTLGRAWEILAREKKVNNFSTNHVSPTRKLSSQ